MRKMLVLWLLLCGVVNAASTTVWAPGGKVGAGTVLAGPTSGGNAQPTFRALDLTTDVTGTLPVNKGGSGAASFTANYVLLGNGTSAFQAVAPGTSGNVLTSNGTTWTSAAPTSSGTVTSITQGTGMSFSASPITTSGTINLADTAVSPGSYTRASITVDQQGRLTAASSGGSIDLTADVSGALPVINGGTGGASLTSGYALVGNGTSPVSLIAPTSNRVLRGNGTTWSAAQVALATDVSGTLPVANGGTGAASFTANYVLLGNNTSAFQSVAPGTSGNVLTSNGTTWTSAAPGGYAPNLILNPQMMFNDYYPNVTSGSNRDSGTSTITTTRAPSATGGYARTRWFGTTSTSTATASRTDVRGATGLAGASYALKVLASTGQQVIVGQIFPAEQFRASSGTVSGSVKIRASGYSQDAYVGIVYLTSSGSDDAVPDSIVATWGAGSGTGITTWGSNVTLLASTAVTLSTTFQEVQVSGTLPGTQRNVALCVWTKSSMSGTNYIEVTEGIFVRGSSIPTFVPPDPMTDRIACYGYSWHWDLVGSGSVSATGLVGNSNGTGTLSGYGIALPVLMPSRKFNSAFGSSSGTLQGRNGTTTATATFSTISQFGSMLSMTFTGTFTSGLIYELISPAGGGDLYIMCCKEL